MAQAPREGLCTWTEATDHSGKWDSPLWLSVRCRSCLSSGRRRSGGDPQGPAGRGGSGELGVCLAVLLDWTYLNPNPLGPRKDAAQELNSLIHQKEKSPILCKNDRIFKYW